MDSDNSVNLFEIQLKDRLHDYVLDNFLPICQYFFDIFINIFEIFNV